MQQMSAQSSPNFGWLEYEGMNDKSVVCWKLSEIKVKTIMDSSIQRFYAGRAQHNEIIIFGYLQPC